jgi:hypothetical protein
MNANPPYSERKHTWLNLNSATKYCTIPMVYSI